MQSISITKDEKTGGLHFAAGNAPAVLLHPLWLRERVTDVQSYDPRSGQRLYETARLDPDIHIDAADLTHDGRLSLRFSDGHKSVMEPEQLACEIGLARNLETLPEPKSWTSQTGLRPRVDWESLDDPQALKNMLHDFLVDGYCIMENTPTERDSLLALAGRFGFVRDTHWGQLFNVEKKPAASDIAYTDAALGAHTDNPYREPIPGLQYLHCLENDVAGGLSTLTDGIAIAEQLRAESPEQTDILERVSVRFRYEGERAILENYGPIIERDHAGIVRRIRLSSRLDFVPALDVKTLDLFYKGRRRLDELANSRDYQIRFPFKKGTLLMMDNYRLLHGRTAFDGYEGRRHLQGCYTDHDGVSSLYRMLARGDRITGVLRDV